MWLEGLKRTGNGEFVVGVAIENVDELLFLDGADHNGAAFGVCGKVLTRHNASYSCLAKCFLVDLDESIHICVEL